MFVCRGDKSAKVAYVNWKFHVMIIFKKIHVSKKKASKPNFMKYVLASKWKYGRIEIVLVKIWIAQHLTWSPVTWRRRHLWRSTSRWWWSSIMEDTNQSKGVHISDKKLLTNWLSIGQCFLNSESQTNCSPQT